MCWISVKDQDPPKGEVVLVIKHYIDQNFDFENGGYGGNWFNTPRYITTDMKDLFGWSGGGVITHWMPLPSLPFFEAESVDP